MNDPTSASSQMFTFGRATQSKGQGFLLQTRVSLSLVSQAAWKCRADFLPTWFHGTLKTHQNISVSTKGTCCFPPTGSSITLQTKPVHHQSSPHFPIQGTPFPVAMIFTLRVRTDSPPPQENWQTLQSTQVSQRQSTSDPGHRRLKNASPMSPQLHLILVSCCGLKITLSYHNHNKYKYIYTICVYIRIVYIYIYYLKPCNVNQFNHLNCGKTPTRRRPFLLDSFQMHPGGIFIA